MTVLRPTLLVGSMALLMAAPAHAQQVATSFEELCRLIAPGETIYITDSSGVTIKGTLVGLPASSSEIQIQREESIAPLRLFERDVNSIVAQRFDSLWDGSLIGFAAGAVPGLLLELAGGSRYEPFIGFSTLSTGVIGLAAGVLVDAFKKERVQVYVQPAEPRASSVRVFPLVSKSRVSVQIAIGF